MLDASLTPRLIQPTTFGKKDGRERELSSVLRKAKIPYQIVPDMHAWQLCHLAMVVPIADAYYEAADPENAGKNVTLMRKTAKQIRDNLDAIAAVPGTARTACGVDPRSGFSKLLRGSVHVSALDESAG